ncbi:Amidase [Lactobacillus brevis ATCC 367] [Lactiplantibacillus mudanjiangensis]|uniref:isochorismatase family protein n=1 Tax=Lactiplantibacillus mudanjiangensis TaxID=1296538 RepID=UPI0010152EC8|nr:Amidase [Lactobacillus brevis ATCC 367] [Lactiplantibacillus mudanjiangensis]
MAQALIVIDLQQALQDLDQRDQVVATVNQRIDQYRAANRPIIFIQHTEPGMEIGSQAWQLFEDLHALGSDTYYLKTRPDTFYQTGLEAFLKMNKLENIEICGAQVEFCVDTTTRVAYHLGFKVDLLIDGISTLDSELLTATQIKAHHAHIWEHRFAEFVTPATPLV